MPIPRSVNPEPATEIQSLVKDSCHNCNKRRVCMMFDSADKALKLNLISMEDDERPGHYEDIFFAVANCCIEYERADR